MLAVGKINGKEVKGEVEFPEVAESEDDYEFRVSCSERCVLSERVDVAVCEADT